MFGINNNDKKMVERPEEEPKFSFKNKVDRTIFIFASVGILVTLSLAILLIVLYYNK